MEPYLSALRQCVPASHQNAAWNKCYCDECEFERLKRACEAVFGAIEIVSGTDSTRFLTNSLRRVIAEYVACPDAPLSIQYSRFGATQRFRYVANCNPSAAARTVDGEAVYSRAIENTTTGAGAWCRLGIAIPPRASDLKIFTEWLKCYHGTVATTLPAVETKLRGILNGSLLRPGDTTFDGKTLSVAPGHITNTEWSSHVFTTPSIEYAASSAYSGTVRIAELPRAIQVVLELRQSPVEFLVHEQTLRGGFRDPALEHWYGASLEWLTKARDSHIVTGVLVRFAS